MMMIVMMVMIMMMMKFVVKTYTEEPASQGSPVKHFTDASKIPHSILRATVRTRRDDVEKLVSLDQPDASKSKTQKYKIR